MSLNARWLHLLVLDVDFISFNTRWWELQIFTHMKIQTYCDKCEACPLARWVKRLKIFNTVIFLWHYKSHKRQTLHDDSTHWAVPIHTTCVGLFQLQPDFRIQVSSRKAVEMALRCILSVNPHLSPMIPLSVALIVFQGHSSVSFSWTFHVLIWLSWNFVWLLITLRGSWISHYFVVVVPFI